MTIDPPLRLLAVDNCPERSPEIVKLLEAKGFIVEYTNDPEKLLPLFIEFDPDIIALDIEPIHPDGIELCRKIIECPHVDHPRVILVYDEAHEEVALTALGMGVIDCVRKPICLEEVDGIIDRLGPVLDIQRTSNHILERIDQIHDRAELQEKLYKEAKGDDEA